MKIEKSRIKYAEFLSAVNSAPCSTLSGSARPFVGETAYQYDCQIADLIQWPVYPVWFVNESHTEFIGYDQPNARPVRVEDLAMMDNLIQPMLASWCKSGVNNIDRAAVIILHCAGCERRVLIDGVHRIIWLLSRGRHDATVHVFELSGSQWPANTPDMNVVCSCRGK
jgi:hypothetical protein